ncbi:MAG: MarR family transcriptional regulator, partial [Ferruginibacter sp.]
LGKRFSDTTIMMHEAIASKAGLTGTDHKYLNFLIEKGPMTAGELANLCGLTTGAVTGVIDRLEKRKLVKREFVKNDRRKVIIAPNLENVTKVLGPPFKSLKEKVLNLVSLLTESEKLIIEKYLNDAIFLMEEVTSELENPINFKNQ